ncbi:MAG: hypothetical protein ACLU7D_08165 [Collinsella sp.]
MSISRVLGGFFHLVPVAFLDGAGRDGDGAGGADEFAELAGDAAFASVLALHQHGIAAVIGRQVLVPAEFRVLHGDADSGAGQFLLVAGLARQSQGQVLDGDPQTAQDGLQVEPLSEGNLRALDRFEGHNILCIGIKGWFT